MLVSVILLFVQILNFYDKWRVSMNFNFENLFFTLRITINKSKRTPVLCTNKGYYHNCYKRTGEITLYRMTVKRHI